MAHELEISASGDANMAYVGQVPWHGLGKRVPSDVSPEQMLKAANLDWTVEKRPLFFESDEGLVATKARALVRSTDNKVLTVISENWNPVQNIEAFEFFNDFVAAGDMEMHTAGSLRDGKMVWAMAQIKNSFELFGGDKVEGYLLFSNPHEFGRSIDIRFTPVRVVCNSEENIKKLAKKLGLDYSKANYGAFDKQFVQYYGLSANQINNKISMLTFKNIINELKPYLKKNKELLKNISKEQLLLYKKAKK